MPDSSTFIHQMRSALVHLYDPDILRMHPLLAVFKINNQSNPHILLRNILLKGIEALKPQADIPSNSRSWRVYRVLNLRFIQQMDQEQTAYQLGIGVRHLRREQKAAIHMLAYSLMDQYPLELSECSLPSEELGLIEEFFWLKSPAMEISTGTSEVISKALEIVSALAKKFETRLQSEISPDLPPLDINPAGLRHVFISLVSYAINRAPKGQVLIRAAAQPEQVALDIRSYSSMKVLPGSPADAARLDVARSILTESGIMLEITESTSMVKLTVQFPVNKPVKVVLVDDNDDIFQLVNRYAVGTRYQFVRAITSEDLFRLVREIHPQVIILDIMIPGMDGWEFLGRLRHNPLTSDLPVIICSVLPERDLALSLGAAAYMPKPITRQVLLSTLNMVLGAG